MSRSHVSLRKRMKPHVLRVASLRLRGNSSIDIFSRDAEKQSSFAGKGKFCA